MEYDDGHNEEVDGGGVDPLVDLGGGVGEEEVVAVDVVLDEEEQEAEGRDERAGDAVHHRHGEDEHEARVLLPEAELVLERLPDEGPLRRVPRQAHVPGVNGELCWRSSIIESSWREN